MSEENNSDAPEPTDLPEGGGDPTPPVLDQDPAPYAWNDLINSDGTFNDGWVDRFESNDLKGSKQLQQFKTIEGMANTLVHQRKEMDRLRSEKGIVPPDETTPDDEAREFWRKLNGAPDSKDGYEFDTTSIEEAFGGIDTGSIDSFREFAHENNLSPKLAQSLVDFDTQRTVEAMEALKQQKEEAAQAVDSELTREWGGSKENNLAFAKKAFLALGGSEESADMVASDPVLAKAFYKASEIMGEGSLPQTVGELGAQGIQERIDEYYKPNHPYQNPSRTSPGEKNKMDKELMILLKQRRKISGK